MAGLDLAIRVFGLEIATGLKTRMFRTSSGKGLLK
jgi:hypothetical protein